MLQVSNMTKSFGERVLFDNVTFNMERGERLGLVGRNGSGKSTLFRLILGDYTPDTGSIAVPKRYRIGHLEQHLNFTKKTVVEEASLGLPAHEADHFYKAERILMGLGFSYEDLYRSPHEFSGGYQIRIQLTKVLVSDPDLLLLDEPTNYLDIVALHFFVDFLKTWKRELIVISHDRDFMDQVTTHTMGFFRGKLKKVKGDTSKLYEQVAEEEEIYEKTRQNVEKQKRQLEVFVTRFRAKASKAKQVSSKSKMIERLGTMDELKDEKDLEFSFNQRPLEAKRYAAIKDLSFGYVEDHLLFQNLSFDILKNDRIAVIGKNGKGKSTLLNVLSGNLTPKSGEMDFHPNLEMGFFGQTNIDRLEKEATIEQEVERMDLGLPKTKIRAICGTMMFSGDDALKKIKVLSGGERARVQLGQILARPCNLLLLDEPTNHLDMESIEGLLDGLDSFKGPVIIVTHSVMIIERLCNKLIVFREKGDCVFYDGNYEDFPKEELYPEEF